MNSIPSDKCRLQQSFWSAMEHAGLPPTAVLRQARLPVTLHFNPQQMISTAQFFAIWKAMGELSADSDLWLKFIESTDAIGHQPMFIAACYAADFGDALRRIVRFKRFTIPERFKIAVGTSEVVISKDWYHASEPEPPMSVDVSFGYMMALGRRGTGQGLTPLRLELAGARARTGTHEEFFRCPIRFEAPADLLILSRADFERPFPGHNAELLGILTPALEQTMGTLRLDSSCSEQVKVVLKRGLASGRPDIAQVARDLGTSQRTLQRRITKEGGSFRALVQEARQELGHQMLADSAADIAEVACLLGFHDLSSFYRAFRSWEGVTPQTWRTQHRAAALH